MKAKKTAAIVLAAIAVVLVLLAVQIRVVPIAGQRVFLLDNPFFSGSGSAGNDIKNAFQEAGKSSDQILDIGYIGTNAEGNYYACTYREADGSVRTYYALDDGDPNSTVRAEVLWEEP